MKFKTTARVWKTGTSYVITIPKALVDSGIVKLGQKVSFRITPKKERKIEDATKH